MKYGTTLKCMLNYIKLKTEDKIRLENEKIKINVIGNFDINKNNFIFGDNKLGLLYLKKQMQLDDKIDLIYIDPPFNTKQDFFIIDDNNQKIVAYFDNMAKSQYFNFLRERLLLLKDLLSENGSIYLHIDCKIGHYIKIIMDEIFGIENFKNDITRIKSNPKNFSRKAYGNEKDMILFYVKNKDKNIWNEIRRSPDIKKLEKRYNKIDKNGRRYTTIPLHAPGITKNGKTGEKWRNILPPKGRHWRCNPEEFDNLDKQGLIEWSKNNNPRIIKYMDENKGAKIQDIWDFKDPQNSNYPTTKNLEMLKLIIKQSSLENSIILDCFVGSGATLIASSLEKRRWIGIDNSIISKEIILSNESIINYNFIEVTEKVKK